MIGNTKGSSTIVENPDFVQTDENHIQYKKNRKTPNRHLTVWDRRGERDKRMPENFVKNRIAGAQIRLGQKYAGLC
jgi:hypothetical protein